MGLIDITTPDQSEPANNGNEVVILYSSKNGASSPDVVFF